MKTKTIVLVVAILVVLSVLYYMKTNSAPNQPAAAVSSTSGDVPTLYVAPKAVNIVQNDLLVKNKAALYSIFSTVIDAAKAGSTSPIPVTKEVYQTANTLSGGGTGGLSTDMRVWSYYCGGGWHLIIWHDGNTWGHQWIHGSGNIWGFACDLEWSSD